MHKHANDECFQCKHGGREDALQMTRLEVAKFQTVNIGVSDNPKDESPFIYSIGLLQNFNHPEIIITGLPLRVAHVFLNEFREVIKTGLRIEPEKIYTEFSQGNLPLVFKTVAKNFQPAFLGYGLDYYRTFEPDLFRRFSAFQMVWSDTKGRFPWEPGFEFIRKIQPLLFEQTKKLTNSQQN